MRTYLSIAVLSLLFNQSLFSQNLYFPPNTNNLADWETLDPSTLGWCVAEIDSLYALLETGKTKGFMLLKDGKIVLEKYFNGHDASKNWQWNSAGKTLTAVAVGLAEQENLLDFDDPSSDYLGQNWTSCNETEETVITVRHQLTMTTGLDDGVADVHCTDAACLACLAAPSTRWAYHNAPYTLLDGIIEGASGENLNVFLQNRLKTKIGMQGLFVKIDYNNVYFSTTRSMARFGLFLQGKGAWNGQQIFANNDYIDLMRTPSQQMNQAYGYLTWLNGSNTFMLPSTQFVFSGQIIPSAPADLYAALGKDDQYLQVVPSMGLVLVRMGESADNALVPIQFAEKIWQQLNKIICTTEIAEITDNQIDRFIIYPNPNAGYCTIEGSERNETLDIEVLNSQGQVVFEKMFSDQIEIKNLSSGIYFLKIKTAKNEVFWKKVLVK